MSTEIKQNTVSSLSSIISTIENDRQVYRWFLMFISLPSVKQKLFARERTKEAYRVLERIQTAQIINCMIMIIIVSDSYLIGKSWVLLLGLIPLGIFIHLVQKNRKHVAYISEQFFLDNIHPDEIPRQTLYQICEYFSKQYNVPSLVDTITNQDFIERKILLGAALFIPFIHPFKTWQLLLAIFLIFMATRAIVTTLIALQKLK